MDNSATTIKISIGAIFVVFLQLVIAPMITVNAIVPNFIVAYTVAVVIARPDQNHMIFAFVMGLIYDFVCAGPVGAMSFTLVLCAFIVPIILRATGNRSFVISVFSMILSLLVIELIYGIFMMSLTLEATFMDMLTFRVLPCLVYDIILGIIFLPIMMRVIAPKATDSNYVGDINIDNRR